MRAQWKIIDRRSPQKRLHMAAPSAGPFYRMKVKDMTHPDWWARVVQAFKKHEQPTIGQVSMAMQLLDALTLRVGYRA